MACAFRGFNRDHPEDPRYSPLRPTDKLPNGFQPETLPIPTLRSEKGIYTCAVQGMWMPCFILIARSGLLGRIGSRRAPRMTENPVTQAMFEGVTHTPAA
jgi:hypothetical protein